jgi:hypothetical protein
VENVEKMLGTLFVLYINSPSYFYHWIDHLLTNEKYRSNTHLIECVKFLLDKLEESSLQTQRLSVFIQQKQEYFHENINKNRMRF